MSSSAASLPPPPQPRPTLQQPPRPRASVSKENVANVPISSLEPKPKGMSRAKVWSPEVEEAFRLQEAGWRAVPELLAYGLGEPERWSNGLIKKLPTKLSIEAGSRVLLYFRSEPECEPRYLNRVKIYHY